MTTTILAMKCLACTFEVPAMQEEWSAEQALAAGITLGGILQQHRAECQGRLVDKPVHESGCYTRRGGDETYCDCNYLENQ